MDFLGIQALRHHREARDVREHHGHLLALALERASGGKDLLREVLGGVGSGRGEPFADGRRGAGRRSRRAKPSPAFPAEFLGFRVLLLAGWAPHCTSNLGASSTPVKPGASNCRAYPAVAANTGPFTRGAFRVCFTAERRPFLLLTRGDRRA